MDVVVVLVVTVVDSTDGVDVDLKICGDVLGVNVIVVPRVPVIIISVVDVVEGDGVSAVVGVVVVTTSVGVDGVRVVVDGVGGCVVVGNAVVVVVCGGVVVSQCSGRGFSVQQFTRTS